MKKKRLLLTLLTLLCFLGGARAQQALPYSYGFEDNDLTADGWIANITDEDSGILDDGAVPHSGSYGFGFYFSEDPGFLISPLLTGGTYGVDVSFWYKELNDEYGDEQFQVGYTTDEDETDANNFTYDAVITASTDWQEYTNTFPAGTKRIAIKYIYGDHLYLFLDDFSFEAASSSSCIKPTGLTVSNIGDNSAVLSWTSDADTWDIEVNGTVTENITTNPYTLTGLTENTAYEVKVRTNCGGGSTSEWTSVSFRTNFCAEADQCFITYELADSYGDGWSGNAIKVVDDETSFVLATWTITSGSSASGSLAVCPGRTINFVWVKGDYSSEASWVIKDANDDVITSGGGDASMNTDDVIATYDVVCPSCPKPIGLAATSITTNSATLSWTGTHDSYELQYRLWTQVGEDAAATATLKTYTYDLSAFSGTGSIAIRHYDVTDMFMLNVDDIVVENAGGTPVYTQNFEGGALPAEISNIDLDGDGYVWGIRTNQDDSAGNPSGNGNYSASSASWISGGIGAVTPDNWMVISNVPLGGTLTFVARGQDANYPAENFAVYVSPDASFTEVSSITENSYDATGLEANTPYTWQVKGIKGSEESDWASSMFKTLDDIKVFTTDGDWNVDSNWTPAGVPTADNKVRIDADAVIPTGYVAQAKKATIGTGGSIIIEDGAELKQGSASLKVTMLKEIDAASNGFITSPFNGRTHIGYDSSWSCVDDPTDGDFDFYAFDGTAANGEWINYEYGNNSTTHEFFYSTSSSGILWGEGYFYANDADMTLEFTGTTWSSLNNSMTKDVTYSSSTNPYNGWRLIGNPYTCTAYVRYLDGDDNQTQATFYKLNAAGDGYDVYDDDISLAPGEVAFIQVTESGKILYSSEDLGAAIEIVGTETAPLLPALGVDTDQSATGITINMNSFGIMTYASPYQLDFNSTDDLTAYAATDINTENLTMTQVLVAPAEAGLLLKGTADASYVVRTSNATADDLTDNKLVGVLAPTPVTAEHVYILANGSQGINWYPLDPTDNTIGANKAYLQLTATEDDAISTGARGLGMIFDDGTSTAINLISNGAQNNENGMWYTLQGLRLDKKPTTKGVYIHNGKKVVIK